MLSHVSRVQLFVTFWTGALQVPLFMGLPRQEYWSGMPCPPPGNLPNPGIEPMSLMSPAQAGDTGADWGAGIYVYMCIYFILFQSLMVLLKFKTNYIYFLCSDPPSTVSKI